jgi:predicted dehydrogenase
VGCGTIADTHAEAIAETEYGRLISAFSRTESNLATFCNKFEVKGYSDYQKFLADGDLNVVVVCTPSGTHLDYGEKAAEAGKHLIIEKPIEVSLDRARRLIDCCQANRVKLAVIYQNRFIEDVKKLKSIMDEGALGKIVMVDASVKWFRDQKYYDSAGWRGTLSLDGGGAVINQAIHTVDLLLWLCGDVESLQAYKDTLTHKRIEGEDNAVAALRFKNGAIGVFKASTSIVPPQNRAIEIHGENGTAHLDGDHVKLRGPDLKEEKEDSVKGSGAGASSPLAGMSNNNHKKQYDQILPAFMNDNEPVVSAEESLKSLAFVEGLYLSAKEKRTVYPETLLAG